jgi:enoyl-[acyl-carrier protein] reductase I
VAQALAREGAELAFTYQGVRLEKSVRDLAGTVNSQTVLPCDVTRDEDLAAVFEAIDRRWDGLDILVHSVAFAPRETFDRPFSQTERTAFQTALDVSAFSLIATTRYAVPLMENRGGGAVVTLTFNASQRVYPNYNVMAVAKAALEAEVHYLAAELGPKNIRVNAVSPGPINTAAARGITGFSTMLEAAEKHSPLRRNVESEDAGNAALYLCSPLGRNVTGQVLLVDGGFSVLAIPLERPSA